MSSAFTQSFGTATYNEKEALAGLFIQDNWRVTPNLVVNLGLRYDLQTLTQGNTNFSPRVGFAYDLFGNGNSVLRGGYGMFYFLDRGGIGNSNGSELSLLARIVQNFIE